jgi:Kef-type K+ transport system membrane component KefB
MTDDVRESLMERNTLDLTRDLRVNCWVVVVLSVASTVIFAVVLALSTKVDPDRRLFMGMFLGVSQLSILAMLIIARNNARILMIFITLGAFVCGVCLGPALWYI